MDKTVTQVLTPHYDALPSLKHHKWMALLMLWAITLLLAASAHASLFDQDSGQTFRSWLSNDDSEFLSVDEAFKPELNVYDKQLSIDWHIADGYYLYRPQIEVKIAPDQGLSAGHLTLPPGQEKQDQYLGLTRVFTQQVSAQLPLNGSPTQDQLAVTLRYQGCAEAGLCYPPRTRTFNVDLSGYGQPAPERSSPEPASPTVPAPATKSESPLSIANTEGSTSSTLQSPSPGFVPSEDGRLQNALAELPMWATLGLFFLAGLGLTFTPCVLPMLPIISAITLGQQRHKGRAGLLSLSYVLGMALTYAALGALVGLFGAQLNLQAALQSPYWLIPFSLLFVVLALSMFGLFELKMPQAWQDSIGQAQSQLKGGQLLNVLLLGAMSTLVVSPCLSAPLAGAMAFIASTGEVARGALALWVMGLGMGIPLILVGIFGNQWLPRSGAWMSQVKHLFGLLLLGLAVWLLSRLYPGPITLALWGSLAILSALFLGTLQRHEHPHNGQRFAQALGLILLIYGIALWWGALSGHKNPLRPLMEPPAISSSITPDETAPEARSSQQERWRQTDHIATLKSWIEKAEKPVMIDLYADWCIACQVMEHEVFPDPKVVQALSNFTPIRLDITKNNAAQQQWLAQQQLFGPPSLLFFVQGQEQRPWRIMGEVGVTELAGHLNAIKATPSAQ